MRPAPLPHRAQQAQMTDRLYSSLDEYRGSGQDRFPEFQHIYSGPCKITQFSIVMHSGQISEQSRSPENGPINSVSPLAWPDLPGRQSAPPRNNHFSSRRNLVRMSANHPTRPIEGEAANGAFGAKLDLQGASGRALCVSGGACVRSSPILPRQQSVTPR
jgi:hypothetical protein